MRSKIKLDRLRRIELTALIILIGFTVSVFWKYVRGMYFNWGFPYNTFLFFPEDKFNDFFWGYKVCENPYSVARPDFSHFPVLYLFFRPFTYFSPHLALGMFLVIFVFFFCLIAKINLRPTCSNVSSYQNFFIITFLSYPFLFTLDRANFEAMLFVMTYFFVANYGRNQISLVLLSILIAIKPTHALFLILPLSERRYQSTILILLGTLGLTLLGYWLLPGDMKATVSDHLRNLNLYTRTYAIGNEGLGYGHSLFGVAKLIHHELCKFRPLTAPLELVLKAYSVTTLVSLCLVAAYVFFIEREFWKQVTIIVLAMCLLPPVSGDYKLLNLYVPMYLFINKPQEEKADLLYVWLFALLLIPKHFYHHFFHPIVSISVIINPLLLLLMMLVIAMTGIGKCFYGGLNRDG